MNLFEGKTILVTGGCGSIGSGIVKHLLKNGSKKVISLDSNEIDQFMLKQSISDDRFEIFTADIRNRDSLESIMISEKIDIIYHAAAMKHIVTCENTPTEAVRTNIYGTQNVVDVAVKYGTPKVILISTDKAVCPINIMGATKFVAERIILNGNIRTHGKQVFSCVRFGNVANTRGSVIPVFIQNILEPLSNKSTEIRNIFNSEFFLF